MRHLTVPILFATAGIATAATYQVDFGIAGAGQTTTDSGWNNMETASAGNNPSNLANIVDSTNAASSVSITYNESGTNAGVSGTGANYNGSYPGTVGALPATALKDGLFFQSGVTVTLKIGGLDTNLNYDFLLYGARGNNGGDATYTANGLNSGSGSISSVFGNATETVSITGITPNASGVIDLVLSQSASPAGAGALNAMTLTSVPEPSSTLLLSALAGLALVHRRR